MRLSLLTLALAACVAPGDGGGGGGGGGGFGGGGGGGGGGYSGCTGDESCSSGFVCARDGECLQASDVYTVHVMWTLKGAAADATSCASAPSLELDFSATDSNEGGYGYAPVPCMEGKFTVDKLPNYYDWVDLAREGDHVTSTGGAIDQKAGTVTIDLPY